MILFAVNNLDLVSKSTDNLVMTVDHPEEKLKAKSIDQSLEVSRSRNRRKGNPKKIVEMNYDDTGEVSDIDDVTVLDLHQGNYNISNHQVSLQILKT